MSSASESGNNRTASDVLLLLLTRSSTTTVSSQSSAESIVHTTQRITTDVMSYSSGTTTNAATAAVISEATRRPFVSNASIVVVRDELLWGYIGVCCVFGIVLNMLVVWSLLRTKCNGTLYFLLQISICDIVSLFVASAELLYIQQQHWTLPPESCPVYLALESFSSIATVYLLIALNLHAISTYNLARRTMWREKILTENREEPLVRQSEQNRPLLLAQTSSSTETSRNEIDTENHYSHILSETPLERPSSNVSAENTAVAANVRALDDGYEKPIEDARCSVQYESTLSYQTPSATRSLLIDYSRRKTSVSVVLPVVFVWFVAASASTPLFVFGSVLPSTKVSHVCGVVNFDPHNNQLLQVMVLAIRVVLPTGCLLLTALSVAWTLCAARTRIRPCGLDENVRACLRLALVLSAIYIVTSEQRVFGSQLFEVWSRRPLMLPKYPRFSGATALTLSAVHWMASIIRPLVYWFLDETVRLEIKDGFGWLCGTRSKREGMQSRFLDGEGKP